MATTPKVDSFIDSLRNRILAGEFGDGKLPPFRELVSEYKTSQETMNKAIQALQAEGIVISSGVKGVFVNTNRLRVPAFSADFYEEILKKEIDPVNAYVEKPEIVEASEELAEKMNLPKGSKVLKRVRRQGNAKSIFRIIESYFPVSLLSEDMIEQTYSDPRFHLINAIKENSSKTVAFTHEELIARLPNVEEQTKLHIVRTNPIIETHSTHFTSDKKTVVYYTRKILNANLFLLTYDYPVEHWQ